MISEEGGTTPRAGKVNTNPVSDDKKNVKKTGFHKRHSRKPTTNSLEYLTGMMFSALRPATFRKIVKRILGYATLKHGHYTG